MLFVQLVFDELLHEVVRCARSLRGRAAYAEGKEVRAYRHKRAANAVLANNDVLFIATASYFK